MFDFTQLFIAKAWAQAATTPAADPAAAGGAAAYMNIIPFVLVLAVFYVLVIRPQQKKLEEQNKMIKALQRGDRVVTSGGIHGKISKIEGDDTLVVEIADGVNVKLMRSHVQSLAAKTQPIADGDDGEKKN